MQQLLQRGAAVTQHRTDEILDASWDDLKSFLACARYKSFRNAAEVLGLTSTTLMRRIDRLEECIGCKLFLRDQSGLTLSDEGAAMIADVTEMERYAFNIFRRASRSSNNGAGTVRVAVTEGPGNFWILPRLIDFHVGWTKPMSQSWKPTLRFSWNRRLIPILSSPSSAGFTSTPSFQKNTANSMASRPLPNSGIIDWSYNMRRRWTIPPMPGFWD